MKLKFWVQGRENAGELFGRHLDSATLDRCFRAQKTETPRSKGNPSRGRRKGSGKRVSPTYTLQIYSLKHCRILKYQLEAMESFDLKHQHQQQGEAEQQWEAERCLPVTRESPKGPETKMKANVPPVGRR